MRKKKIIKLISFLIIMFLVFQVIPNTLTSVGNFQSHSQASTKFLASSFINADVLHYGREYQKTSFQKVQIKNPLINIPQILIGDLNSITLSFPEVPIDHRRVIRQSIPHYFNGSKYKDNVFSV
jgi:hypothetical protein